MRALEERGFAARLVGGCVRDALLAPAAEVEDLDLASAATPEEASAIVEALGGKVHPLGAAHGSIGALLGGRRYEITTLRRDVETDGRHAKVAYTDNFEEDAARRDFTINALSLDRSGAVYDPFGGVGDLAAGRVRFVGDAAKRVAEDYLRVMRFFRFYARFGRDAPDHDAMRACAAAASALENLSGERRRAELEKLLGAAIEPARIEKALDAMAESGVWWALFDAPCAPPRAAAARRVGGDWLLALRAALPRDLPSAIARAMAGRLRFSAAERERFAAIAALTPPARLRAWAADDKGRAFHAHGVAGARDAFRASVVFAIEAATDTDEEAAWRMAAAGFEERASAYRPKALAIGGADALALGAAPGPAIGRALRVVERWWRMGGFAAPPDAQRAALAHLLAKERAPTSKKFKFNYK